MSGKRTTKRSVDAHGPGATDWNRVDSMTDEDAEAAALSDPDAPPTDPAFWARANVVLPGGKSPITLRLDNDVLAWFKSVGRGYQSRINAVLRAYMNAHKG